MSASFDYNKQIKLNTVEKVLQSMDLSEINIEQISLKLQQYLGEKPAIRLNNGRTFFINEDGQKTDKKVDKLESIDVVFTVDRDFGGKMIPVPVTYSVKF